MEVLTAATLVALVIKVTGVVKYISSRDWRQVITQVLVWIVAFAVLLVAREADVAKNLTLWGNQLLGDMDTWSVLLMALALGATGSFAYDVKKAVDHSDAAVEPPLHVGVGGSTPDQKETTE